MRGGIDVRLPHVRQFPDSPLDVLNCVPHVGGYAFGPGWARLGNVIDAVANGRVNHLTGFAVSGETTYTVAVCGLRFLELVSGTWTSRQNGTNFSMGANDHADTAFWIPTDRLLVFAPLTGAANAPRQWTGSGNISTVGASIRNARWGELFGNRILLGGTWDSDGTYRPTRVYRSSDGSITATFPAEFTDFTQSSWPVMNVKRLGQMLIVYKQYTIGVLQINSGENLDLEPFLPDEVPANIGLALPEALVSGGRGHFFLGNENIYLLQGLHEPIPVGSPIMQLLHGDRFAAGSFALAGYDVGFPERESHFLLTNVGTGANDATIGPNTTAVTYQMFMMDWDTKGWSRHELTTIPRAAGSYFTRYGYLDVAPVSRIAALIGLDSGAADSAAFEFDYSNAQRVGAAVTAEILSPIFHLGDPFVSKVVGDVWLGFKRKTTGNLTLTWYVAQDIGDIPGAGAGQSKAVTIAMDGTTGPRSVNLSGRIHQFKLTSTDLFDFDRVFFKYGIRN